MSKKTLNIKPIAAAVGVAFVTSMAISGHALASENPFEAADLDRGYMLAEGHDKGEEGKCGEGKCGEEGDEGKCGEGKCGEEGEEGKCGEGKCGEEGEEGKCGEGKCGDEGDDG